MEPYYQREGVKLYRGDCLEVMWPMKDGSVDAVVTDPPAGISFMGKSWDKDKGGRDQWVEWMRGVMRECLRVLKPGGHAVVWALPRTSHWTATAIEDAGFEIRDVIHHAFGTGFPKSMDVSKAIDKQAGAEREVVGIKPGQGSIPNDRGKWGLKPNTPVPVTVPATAAAQQWEGWGTALKPAAENWIIARKPLSEPTVAANVLKHGTGAINGDGCRVKTSDELGGGRLSGPTNMTATCGGTEWDRPWMHDDAKRAEYAAKTAAKVAKAQHLGRWPANLVLSHAPGCRLVGEKKVIGTSTGNGDAPVGDSSRGNVPPLRRGTFVNRTNPDGTETVPAYECVEGCPVAELDRQSGERKPGRFSGANKRGLGYHGADNREADGSRAFRSLGDRGGASRFFNTFEPDDVSPFLYCAKASRSERGKYNKHPTVKPIKLMRHLVRLVTPTGGIVLDPFAGSGSTGVAALQEGLKFIGIEREEEYLDIACKRLSEEK